MVTEEKVKQQRLEGCEDPEADKFEELIEEKKKAGKKFTAASASVQAANAAIIAKLKALKKVSVTMPDGKRYRVQAGEKLVVEKADSDSEE